MHRTPHTYETHDLLNHFRIYKQIFQIGTSRILQVHRTFQILPEINEKKQLPSSTLSMYKVSPFCVKLSAYYKMLTQTTELRAN